MNICVVGTGYVGLVVGCCLAGSGNRVTCTDTDAAKIAMLNRGEVPIYEPGLEEVLRANEAAGRLHFSTDVGAGVAGADVVFIAVGTPPGEDGSADLQYVRAVAATIGEHLTGYAVIVCKSTVPVGTCDIVSEIVGARTEHPFDVVSNPEFLKEGHAVEDFMRPNRIIVGTQSARARKVMERLYAPFQRTSNRIVFMDVRSSEMTKYAANAMLATRISFMNEIARLCDAVGANVELVRRGIGSDPRIGSQFLFPGAGFGGSCFPKDLRALIRTGREHGRSLQILDAVVAVNDAQKRVLPAMVAAHFGSLAGLEIAIWGLAFKPRTDDVREAPAFEVVEGLLAAGAAVRVTDPVAMPNSRGALGDRVRYCDNEYEALEGADALVVVTEWDQYRTPDFERAKAIMRQAVLFDGRNLYDGERLAELGFTYYSIGRPVMRPAQ
jgi:UDPglucose 6-dehydrogenase